MLKKEQAHLWTMYIKNNKTLGLDQRFPYEILKEEIGADTYHYFSLYTFASLVTCSLGVARDFM